jgi:hypothetical protein
LKANFRKYGRRPGIILQACWPIDYQAGRCHATDETERRLGATPEGRASATGERKGRGKNEEVMAEQPHQRTRTIADVTFLADRPSRSHASDFTRLLGEGEPIYLPHKSTSRRVDGYGLDRLARPQVVLAVTRLRSANWPPMQWKTSHVALQACCHEVLLFLLLGELADTGVMSMRAVSPTTTWAVFRGLVSD